MAGSTRYNALLSRIGQLKISLLPKTKVSGNYTVREQDFTKSFRLLVHAEIESYFEERALDIAAKALKKWVDNEKASLPLLALSCFTPGVTGQSKNVLTKVHLIMSVYKTLVKRNNGIKDENLTSMLVPIGFKESDFDTTWLSTVNSWAVLRGEIAHTTFKVHQPIDPVTEVKTVNLILTGIKDLDLLLNELRLLK